MFTRAQLKIIKDFGLAANELVGEFGKIKVLPVEQESPIGDVLFNKWLKPDIKINIT